MLHHDEPALPRATASSVAKLIEQLGFVQIDTINVIERAHHLILAPRLDGYTPALLHELQRHKKRPVFEHWTHDASIIPSKWFAHWRPRFERYRAMGWHRKQMGKHADRIVDDVLERIRENGPMMSKDFEHVGEKNKHAWWGWKPQKVALDYLWRIGELFIVDRRSFQKVYDLTERAAPHLHAHPEVDEHEHVQWACRSAMERLVVATPREIRDFWNHLKIHHVNAWIKDALARGEIVEVMVESAGDAAPTRAVAPADIKRRIKKLSPASTDSMRLLSPFDPVVRDRARAQRLFNFSYRFEGFVPKLKRRHGYYVMPILEGDRLIGRFDPKLHRDRGELEIRFVDFEPGVKLDRRRKLAFADAVDGLAKFVGAEMVRFPKSAK